MSVKHPNLMPGLWMHRHRIMLGVTLSLLPHKRALSPCTTPRNLDLAEVIDSAARDHVALMERSLVEIQSRLDCVLSAPFMDDTMRGYIDEVLRAKTENYSLPNTFFLERC